MENLEFISRDLILPWVAVIPENIINKYSPLNMFYLFALFERKRFCLNFLLSDCESSSSYYASEKNIQERTLLRRIYAIYNTQL